MIRIHIEIEIDDGTLDDDPEAAAAFAEEIVDAVTAIPGVGEAWVANLEIE